MKRSFQESAGSPESVKAVDSAPAATAAAPAAPSSAKVPRIVDLADFPLSWTRTRPEGNHEDEEFDTSGLPVTLENVLAATRRIEGKVVLTPCEKSRKLSKQFGAEIYLKKDLLQATGSFKERGALNALMQLSKDQRRRGVIAASAGNHALGLSTHGVRLGIPVHVVMPLMAPLTKVTNCREIGAEVIQYGANFDEAVGYAMKLAEEHGYTYIHGFDHPAVIAGQGSIGMEVLDQVPDADIVVVPVGGGGLIAGVSMAIKMHRPQCKIIGVEPTMYRCLIAGLVSKEPVVLNSTRMTIADGLAVKKAGGNCLKLAQNFVDEVITVEEHWVALAILRLIETEKTIVEGAGAVALAALLCNKIDVRGKKVVLLLCGGNIDVNVLGRIIEHGLAADGRLARLSGKVADRPGGLAAFAQVIADSGASTLAVLHDRTFTGDDFGYVTVQVTLETRNHEHIAEIMAKLTEKGYSPALDSFKVPTQ
eukprot:comp21241_c0_seq1/m.45356 comp21241_c0_seq1/g.45356  ORF comp21241_c0_seq1/g.45356 comp21241_c0_seq1/m.45356 type:complete len:479 (-) comp21241_c0_seq1:103-1539(-)